MGFNNFIRKLSTRFGFVHNVYAFTVTLRLCATGVMDSDWPESPKTR